MSIALLLIPDFALILFGFLLHRRFRFAREFWGELEKLIYYVLFPALLFTSIARTTIDVALARPALLAALAAVLAGVALSWLGRYVARTQERTFASAFQTGFRFNSYVGLAVAGRLHGEAGIAAFAIVIALVVPLCNFFSVWALARTSDAALAKELAKNPLILATLAGAAASLSGVVLPEPVALLLTRLGAASLALGLLCVGAALTFTGARDKVPLIAWLTAVKLLAMPIAAIAAARMLGVTGLYFDMLVLLAACPTATSSYVLAVRMGGDGPTVAQSVTVSTLFGMLALPLWLVAARAIA